MIQTKGCIFFNELLNKKIKNKKLLDADCGTRWFSIWTCKRGADVTSMDLTEGLLKQVSLKCISKRVVGSILEIPFMSNSFDIIISSEVIKQTPNQKKAIKELYKVIKPNGTLVLSVPIKFRYFSICVANKLKLRPYDGYESWLGWNKLKRSLVNTGFIIDTIQGVQLFPFVFKSTYSILDFFHRFYKSLDPFMLNISVK